MYSSLLLRSQPKVSEYLPSSAKFLNLAFKIDKLKTKYKNLALCLSKKQVHSNTQRAIHKTVANKLKKPNTK